MGTDVTGGGAQSDLFDNGELCVWRSITNILTVKIAARATRVAAHALWIQAAVLTEVVRLVRERDAYGIFDVTAARSLGARKPQGTALCSANCRRATLQLQAAVVDIGQLQAQLARRQEEGAARWAGTLARLKLICQSGVQSQPYAQHPAGFDFGNQLCFF
jgi:hypothetical protein